jgi:hypothetical protein
MSEDDTPRWLQAVTPGYVPQPPLDPPLEETQPIEKVPPAPPTRHLAAGWHPWLTRDETFKLIVWGCPFVFLMTFGLAHTGPWAIPELHPGLWWQETLNFLKGLVGFFVLAGCVIISLRRRHRRGVDIRRIGHGSRWR